MLNGLTGRTAIVTGAARGSGAAIAARLVADGASVVVADVRPDGAAVAARLGDRSTFVHCDVTDDVQWQQLVARTVDWTGRVDVLVNNAAILVLAAVQDTSPADFRRVLDVNVTGAFLGIRAVIDPMVAGGGGSIINVASTAGLSPTTGTAAYASSKFALRGLTKTAALELGRLGIRVNSICPAVGSSEMITEAFPSHVDTSSVRATGQATAVLNRWGTTADVAAAVSFLAGSESEFMTGADLVLDGGMTVGQAIEGFPGTEHWPR